eukprot:11203080-Lingulodinium_polyedra.AAC.1
MRHTRTVARKTHPIALRDIPLRYAKPYHNTTRYDTTTPRHAYTALRRAVLRNSAPHYPYARHATRYALHPARCTLHA